MTRKQYESYRYDDPDFEYTELMRRYADAKNGVDNLISEEKFWALIEDTESE
jgi:hypothetical protein